MKPIALVCCFALASLPALALAQQAPTPQPKPKAPAETAAAAKTDPNKLICEMVKPVDSNIKRRVCKTQAQIEQERRDGQRYLSDVTRNAGSSAPGGALGPITP